MTKKAKTKTEESGKNVFADLGFSDAAERYTRACLGVQVVQIIKKEGYSQKEAAVILGVKQPEVSALMSAKLNRFSQERLIGFLNKLNRKVIIAISTHRHGEPFQQVTLVP